MTAVRNIKRADTERAWTMAHTAEGREVMLRKFDRDVHTSSGHCVRSAQMATWTAIHHLWFPGVSVVPLSWDSIRGVAAHMKEVDGFITLCGLNPPTALNIAVVLILVQWSPAALGNKGASGSTHASPRAQREDSNAIMAWTGHGDSRPSM